MPKGAFLFMDKNINIEEFLNLSDEIPVIDVRTPDEFAKGHIANAINIPLFSNEERAIVGTKYKNASREKAIITGLEFVGPKIAVFAKRALKIAKGRKLLIYCWRGGMRSESMAWLFRSVDVEVARLIGGYKAYRNYGKEMLARDYKLEVLGGKTGSGKTEILYEIQKNGEQMVDLEGLAHHKGSAFGFIHQKAQQVNENFENALIEEFRKLDLSKRIWLEDESKNIGRNFIPDELFTQMKANNLIFIEMPIKCRVDRLVKEYADTDISDIELALNKIQKRLGFDNYKKAQDFLDDKDFASFTEMMLVYYDKAYLNSLNKREEKDIKRIEIKEDNAVETAKYLISFVDEN